MCSLLELMESHLEVDDDDVGKTLVDDCDDVMMADILNYKF